jgi:hypothetical protein
LIKLSQAKRVSQAMFFLKVKISHYGNDNKSIVNYKKEFLGKFTQKLPHCEDFLIEI